MENRGSEDNELPREMWKAVETGTGEIRIEKAERRGSKGRSQKEKEGER